MSSSSSSGTRSSSSRRSWYCYRINSGPCSSSSSSSSSRYGIKSGRCSSRRSSSRTRNRNRARWRSWTRTSTSSRRTKRRIKANSIAVVAESLSGAIALQRRSLPPTMIENPKVNRDQFFRNCSYCLHICLHANAKRMTDRGRARPTRSA